MIDEKAQTLDINTSPLSSQAMSLVADDAKKLLKTGVLQTQLLTNPHFALIATDQQGVVQVFNAGAECMLGYQATEVLNAITPAALADPVELINRAQALSLEFGTSIAPGFEALIFKAARDLEDKYELSFVDKEGRRLPAMWSVTALRDQHNEVIGYLLMGIDNSSRKRVEEDSKRFFSVSQDLLCIASFDGYFKSLNSAWEKTLGFSCEEIMAKPIIESIYPEDREDTLNHIQKLIAVPVTDKQLYENRYLCKDGSYRWLLWSTTVVVEDQLLYASARDVTEYKEAREALLKNNIELQQAWTEAEKANRAKSEFLSSMSHELRTPLSAILGFAQLIDSATPPPTPAQKSSVDQILQAGWYLLDLINEILDLALIESGKLSLLLEPILLEEVMCECEMMIEPQAERRGITLSFEQRATEHVLHADRTRTKQVIINLLSNAIKYNIAGGTVNVHYATSKLGFIRICISDSGEGLPPEKMAQLFQPFNRLGQELGCEEGTGIGLVLSKRLIELMGGTIGVESTVGKGSTFWVEFKLSAQSLSNAISTENLMDNAESVKVEKKSPTILYVEDNAANLMLVENLIARRADLNLISTLDGHAGIALARNAQPDMILMDINLPGINGVNALQILRNDPLTAHIPVVALSANAMSGDIEKGLQAGFFRYLTKPIVLDQFMEIVDLTLKHARTKLANKDSTSTDQKV
ncbi:MAG: PAS domain S-box protein [Gammaproteobacteria bacterium]|nr:PAS domain S-box protein [Gammaproteobacteria bacterium]